ncbi:conserved within P. aerophilum [Pyrobaculum aerophilum str. IM2]|uniref:Conserved within P. aerophilum n=2 Tax=Pyrobaculum aerophilum TaxID=13773 RepID=Q8ZTH2_PYRAE|nr:GTPase domain-containing protein [Pyrobaculum aerophilum]AAL64789.1 conserved within P. aerophilum [Pyrobaculum aerophilum str. IM2]HII47601.1 GTPase domain-containing protein [Pyrobaculum aerophilum]
MPRHIAVLLGVGGVGKTTLVYRLMGLSIRPTVTLRPGIYRLYIANKEINLIDVPGQYVFEVVQNFARMWSFYVDKAVYMYDVLDYDTLRSLVEIHSRLLDRGIKPFKRLAVVGNKMDLAREYGVQIEADEIAQNIGANEIFYISALRDDPRDLVRVIL